ncbi:hypothetical protein AXF42_Ash002686 [Apostasia shenzhenica]|uniref:Uncharacterized protein n=1 Tax=Apostasia shenzhenica TaxID=1088818 RepID=A0A2I0A703_9ASPA|nr:hypothetical protein AXF42_Ash002686 [Apostasia shenzhenica]
MDTATAALLPSVSVQCKSWRTRSLRNRSRSSDGDASYAVGLPLFLSICRTATTDPLSANLSFQLTSPSSILGVCTITSDLGSAAWPSPAAVCNRDGRRRYSNIIVASSTSWPSFGGGEGQEKEDGDEGEEVERALGMDGSIPGGSEEFLRRVSSRAYDMRHHLMQTIDTSSFEVLDSNPWREESKPVFVLTQWNNQLCTMKTRKNHSEVERELGLLFSRRKSWDSEMDNEAKHARSTTKFSMFVEDIREGVLVFEDENEATRYCELLQVGGQGCEGIAELEVSLVFDICQKMRAIAVLFRRGRSPPLPKSLEKTLRDRKRSLEDQDIV